MPVPTLTCPPSRIESGNTVMFTDGFSQYPATLWTMEFVLSLDGNPTTVKATTASGTLFSVTIPSNLKPGVYDFAEYVTEISSGQRTTARVGTIEVLTNLAVAASKSFAKQMVDGLEVAILKLATGTNLTVNFNGQSFTKKDGPRMREELTFWQAAVLREKANSMRGRQSMNQNRAQIRFVPDSVRVPVSEF